MPLQALGCMFGFGSVGAGTDWAGNSGTGLVGLQAVEAASPSLLAFPRMDDRKAGGSSSTAPPGRKG